jgi:hypothetical protein
MLDNARQVPCLQGMVASFTDPFKQAGESEVSNLISINYDCKLSELSFVILSSSCKILTHFFLPLFIKSLKSRDMVLQSNLG